MRPNRSRERVCCLSLILTAGIQTDSQRARAVQLLSFTDKLKCVLLLCRWQKTQLQIYLYFRQRGWIKLNGRLFFGFFFIWGRGCHLKFRANFLIINSWPTLRDGWAAQSAHQFGFNWNIFTGWITINFDLNHWQERIAITFFQIKAEKTKILLVWQQFGSRVELNYFFFNFPFIALKKWN